MKKIGIVGGIAWRSTVDYYSGICSRSEQWQLARNPRALPSMPEISIESLDLSKAVSYLGADDDDASWDKFDDYHRAALQRLEANGVDFALLASNTCHHRFEAIVRGVRIPVISILDATAEACARMGADEVLILGTSVTMRSARFRGGFEKYGITAVGPHKEALRARTAVLIADLQLGKLEGGAERLGKIARSSFEARFRTQPAVCLACTELALALPDQKMLTSFEHDGVRYINTTTAHIEAAFNFALNE